MRTAGSAVARAWRIFASGLSFSVFGVGALLVTVTALPVICLLIRAPSARRYRLQRTFSGGCRFFIGFMKALRLVEWQVQGRERLEGRGLLVLANHPSLLDAVFLLAWMPEAVCVVKQPLYRNPFLGWPVRAAGYIDNENPQKLVQACVSALHRGDNLILFPEGTRSVPGRAAVFKRGAARIAAGSRAPLVPVRIKCQPLALAKGMRWYQLPDRPVGYYFDIGITVDGARFTRAPGESAAQEARRVTAALEQLLLGDDQGDDKQGDRERAGAESS